MSGTLTPFGVLSLSQAMPGMAQLDAAARLMQATAKAEIGGKLAGALSVGAALTIPPLPGVTAVAAAKLAVQLALNPSIAAPGLQLSANAALIAQLRAKLALELPDFGLGTFGVAAYHYEGEISDLGSRLGAATAGGLPGGQGSDFCVATILVTEVPAVAAALAKILIST